MFTLLALVFVAVGILLVSQGNWAGWLSIVFFGLGILVFASELVSPSILTVDQDGFTSRPAWPGRSARTEWTECGVFRTLDSTGGLGRQNMVLYTTAAGRGSRLGQANRQLVGGSDALRAGYAGLSAVELASLLNQYRNASTGRSGSH